MFTRPLIEIDIRAGEKALAALDCAELNVKVAVWMLLSDHRSDYGLIVASSELDSAGIAEGYGLVHEALRKADIPFARRPQS